MIKRRLSQITKDLEEMIARRRNSSPKTSESPIYSESAEPSAHKESSNSRHTSKRRFENTWPPLRFFLELLELCYLRLEEHKASQMAAALSYRTIFAIVPVIILGMLGFRLFGNSADAYGRLSKGVTTLLSYDVKAETPEAIEFKENINSFVRPFIIEISETKLQSIGIIGGILFIWAALSFFVTAEQIANEIFDIKRGRTWDKRIVRYWTILTLGPLVVVAGVYLLQSLHDSLHDIKIVGPVMALLYASRAYIGSWLILLLFTTLMPKCKVSLSAAAAASAFVALIWTFGRWAFSVYVGHFLPYSKLYGTIGLIPLGLLWLYMNWYVALLGMVLTNALQVLTSSPNPNAQSCQ